MARLRIRIELSRNGVGVPLGKLASVVDETQKFLHMLAEDIHIGSGEWLGFDFDHESLNFTAEYVGPVESDQVRAFYAAFDGTTSLRRATIGQFTKITDALTEDELIGFGLYDSDHGPEPSEWRCLSRRDAARIAEEIKLLLKASGEQESHLPAVTDAGARLFGRGREEEPTLEERLSRVERRVEQHSTEIHDLRSQSSAAEDSFRNLLSAVESFCDQATQQIERVTPAALPAPALPADVGPVHPVHPGTPRWGLIVAGVILAGAILFGAIWLWPVRSVQSDAPRVVTAAPATAAPVPPAPVVTAPPPAPAPSVKPTPHPGNMRLDLEPTEVAWVSLTDANGNSLLEKVLAPGDLRTIDINHAAKLRVGNAGGLIVKLDGKPLGTLGPKGKIRQIDFQDGQFKITSPN
jgi:hypothetical protein